jgi:dihydroorotate dehydrogenase electron transfer subunit
VNPAAGSVLSARDRPPSGPLQVQGEVLSVRPVGDYLAMRLVAPGIAERARPGSFVALAVGGAETSMLLRRSFSIYRTSTRGHHGGTVDIVFAVHGKGTAWLAQRRPHELLDVVGPLGRPFPLPRDPANAVLVGGGYGSAPLFTLAEELRRRRCRVDFVLGASTERRLFGADEARRLGSTVTLTTEDASAGERGWVTDVLPEVMSHGDTNVVYACGPMAMLRAVSAMATERGAVAQTAVEEAMACGVGVCMTCVLPVVGEDGRTRMVRACTDGPVFRGDRVRWDDIGTVPADTWGAPDQRGH